MATGLDPSQFWDLTFREIAAVMDGAILRVERDHDDRAWAAWHNAHLATYAPENSRNFPSLGLFLTSGREEREEADRRLNHERVRDFFRARKARPN